MRSQASHQARSVLRAVARDQTNGSLAAIERLAFRIYLSCDLVEANPDDTLIYYSDGSILRIHDHGCRAYSFRHTRNLLSRLDSEPELIHHASSTRDLMQHLITSIQALATQRRQEPSR